MPARKPTVFSAHIVMTASYSLLGGDEEARAEAAEALRLNPKFSALILPYSFTSSCLEPISEGPETQPPS